MCVREQWVSARWLWERDRDRDRDRQRERRKKEREGVRERESESGSERWLTLSFFPCLRVPEDCTTREGRWDASKAPGRRWVLGSA